MYQSNDQKQQLIEQQNQIDADELQQINNRNLQITISQDQVTAIQPIETQVMGILTQQSFPIVRKTLNPFIYFKHVTVSLSSDTAEILDQYTLGWSFSNGQLNARRGVVSSKDLIKNIIGFKLSPGYFPWNPLTAPPYQRQIYILITQYDSFALRNQNIAYHFCLTPSQEFTRSTYIRQQETTYDRFEPNFDGYFWLPNRVQDIDYISLKFATKNMYFDPRRVLTAYHAGGVAPANPLLLNANAPNIVIDQQRYIFYTALVDPFDATFYEQLTREDGWIASVVSPTEFTIPLDGSYLPETFYTVYFWVYPIKPQEFTMNLDIIYLGDQET